MIRREHDSDWLLISQVDHAHLSADLAAAWGNDRIDSLPASEILIPAIQDHDEGWREWERCPEIDPESGWPRNFTEMPAGDSTQIWRKSIEHCRRGRHSIVASVDEFRRFLGLAGLRLSHERAIVAEEVFSSWEAFSTDELLNRLSTKDDGQRVSRASVYRTLSLMEEARLVRKVSLGTYQDAYEQTHRIGGGSILGGIWVSRHFSFLAERVLREPSHETPQWQAFLKEQYHLQNGWSVAIEMERGRTQAESLIDQGTRWVQFFDLLSLWLCCQDRETTESFETPAREKIHLTPLPSGEIAAEPFPFADETREVSVEAKRIGKKIFANRAELQTEIESATSAQLCWKLVRW